MAADGSMIERVYWPKNPIGLWLGKSRLLPDFERRSACAVHDELCAQIRRSSVRSISKLVMISINLSKPRKKTCLCIFHGTCYLNFDRSRRITKRPVKIDGTGALLSSNQTWVASRWSWLKMRNKPYCRFPHVTNRNWSKMGSCHKKIALPFLEWKKAVPAWLENLLHCIVCGPFNEETGCSFTGINSSNVLKWYVGMFSSSICKTVSKKRLHFSFFNLKCEVEILAYLCSFKNNLLKVVFHSG